MDNRGGKKTCKYYKACGSSDNCVRCKGYERRNPSQLPDDWRVGKYVPKSPYANQIVATVDVMWNAREILMHDETNDKPFTLSPQKLRKEWKRL